MKRAHIFAGIVLLTVLLPWAVSAKPWGQGIERSLCAPSGGISLESLDLTEEQRAAVQKFEKVYTDHVNVLQGKLMSKRLELQSLFRNPRADEEALRAKAREVFELQDTCRQMAMDYQIQIRRVLTPEQLRNWCTQADWCFPWNRRK